MHVDDHLYMQDKDRDQKLEDVTAVVLENIQSFCHCGFLNDRITGRGFHCLSASPQAVTYRATIHGTASTDSSQLISHIEQWTDGGTNIIVQQAVLRARVNESCTDVTTTPEDEECPLSNPTSPTASKSNNYFAFIGGALVIGIIAGVSITSFIAIIICCVLRHRARTAKKNAQSSPPKRYF